MLFEYLSFWQFGFGLRSASAKFINSTGNVQQVLFASVEWMTIWTDFNMEFLFGRTRDKGIAASADNLGIRKILWVDLFFHNLQIIALINRQVKKRYDLI